MFGKKHNIYKKLKESTKKLYYIPIECIDLLTPYLEKQSLVSYNITNLGKGGKT